MKKGSITLGCTLFVALVFALGHMSRTVDSQAIAPARTNPAALFAFRDSVDTPPANWAGPTFKLSHNYPKVRPKCEAPWLKRPVNFSNPNPKWEDWKDYVQDIINYVAEGQDPNLPDNVGWRTEVNGQTRWFHIPWMAYDAHSGREFVHGLTNELSTALSTFRNDENMERATGKQKLDGAAKVKGEDPLFETWSVGMYNPCGAWSVGQVFPASGAPATHRDPKTGQLLANGLPFPEGTVVMKLLNTTADPVRVPYLKNSTSWQANGHKKLVPVPTDPSDYTTYDRAITTVHLVQVDLAVIDPRSPTRWVYSTLAYDGTRPGPTVWSRLVPLGVQWGSDPQSFPAVPNNQSKPLWQSVLAPTSLPEHYGCGKRLAGVVDNPSSSCVSCHMGAYAAAPGEIIQQGKNVPLVFVPKSICQEPISKDSRNYFSNYKYPMPYPGSTGAVKAAIPLDSSLQLQVAFLEYAEFMNGHQ